MKGSIAKRKRDMNKCSNERSVSLDEAVQEYYVDGSEQKLEAVVKAGGKIVNYFIRLYGYGQPYEDLYQVSIEGLLKALKRYKSETGISFTTYAGNLIIGEIRHYIRKESSYYWPKTLSTLQRSMDKFILEKIVETGDTPSMREIVQKMNIKQTAVKEVMRAGLVPLEQLDLSSIASQRYQSFQLPIEDKILLEQALYKLDDLQRNIIEMLFFKDMTQCQVAQRLGIHQRKVSRVLHSSMKLMRGTLSNA